MKQPLTLTTKQTQCLTDITRASTSPQRLVQRANMILGYARSGNQSAVAKEVKVDRDTVHLWLSRWRSVQTDLERLEAMCQAEQLSACLYRRKIECLLCDAPRPGAPPTFSEAQKQHIIALASETRSAGWCTGNQLEPRSPSPNSHDERDCPIYLSCPSWAFFKRQPHYSHTAAAIGNIPTSLIGTSLLSRLRKSACCTRLPQSSMQHPASMR
jgi:hypothetical protein